VNTADSDVRTIVMLTRRRMRGRFSRRKACTPARRASMPPQQIAALFAVLGHERRLRSSA
jgi:hypothetical protein